MIGFIRKRLSYANVAMTLALVFAMTGGAYAAKKYLITNTKQIKPSVLKQLQGKAGPVGPEGKAGAAGPAGAKGENGAPGTNGTNGANGKDGVSPEGVAFTGAAHGCTEGGVEFKGANTTYACNGKKGTTGFTKTLPSKQTETGVWSFGFGKSVVFAGFKIPVASFVIPLEVPIATGHVHYINPAGKEVIENESEELEEVTPTQCPGNAAEPMAEPGNLCVYAHLVENALTNSAFISDPGSGTSDAAGVTGAVQAFLPTSELRVNGEGTWAVTAP
jgi:collagen triple helix repeat protein